MGFDFSNEATETNAKFAGEIARLTSLKTVDVERLFPTKVDKERVVELLTIVRSSTSRNTRAAKLQANIQNLGGAVIKLLDVLV